MKKLLILFLSFLLLVWPAYAGPGLGEAGRESILVISDTHLTGDARRHADAMEAVIHAALGRDAVLFLGDNTNNSHAGEHDLVLQWARIIEQRSGARVFLIPGNHDYSTQMGAAEFSARYGACGWDRAFSRDAATASYAVLTDKGTCLLMLDTNRPDPGRQIQSDGGIAEDTLNWLREVLETLSDGTPVIACGHHPILPAERNERTPGAGGLSRILQAYGVGLYLCGHDHGFAAVEQSGLRQITVGQPQAYPGWAGVLEKKDEGFDWHTQPIYDPLSPVCSALREDALALGRTMARGALTTTPYADDQEAVEWFAGAFMSYLSGELTPEGCAALLADDNCRKWREAETRTVVKSWIFGLLEHCPEDVRHVTVLHSQKHAGYPEE